MIITWPTLLTLIRIMLTPYIVLCIASSQWAIATGVFIIAALTDVFDGALARYTSQETEFGIYLDPFADKLLIVSCYMALLYVHGPSIGIPPWLLLLVVAREITFIGGALLVYFYAYANNSLVSVSIQPTLAGKLTTVVHCTMLGIIYTTQAGLWHIDSYYINLLALVAAILMVVSGIQYGITWRERVGNV